MFPRQIVGKNLKDKPKMALREVYQIKFLGEVGTSR